jgi:ubiquinone biosynthesis protein COQ4
MLTRILSAPRDEAEAMQIALTGTRLERTQLGLRAGIALALDTTDTRQVFYLAIAVDRETLPRVAQRLAADPSGRELMRTRAAIDSKHVDFEALRALPPDTLGGAYSRALQAQGLNPDIFQRPPGLPDDLAYVAQRARQTHDLWHVLTGLSTDIPGEVALQAFTDAQLNQNFSKLIVTFGLTFFGLRYPRMWSMVKRARRAGAEAKFLLAVRWEDWWAAPLSEVRAAVGVPRLA